MHHEMLSRYFCDASQHFVVPPLGTTQGNSGSVQAIAHRKNTFLLLLLFVVVIVTSHQLDCDVNLVLKYVASTPDLHSSGSVRSIEIDAASDQPENHHHHQLHGSKL